MDQTWREWAKAALRKKARESALADELAATAKTELHSLIREFSDRSAVNHLARRDVAEATSLSFQRVQQIVHPGI